MKQTYTYRDKQYNLEVNQSGKRYLVTSEGQKVPVELVRVEGGEVDLLIDGKLIRAIVTKDGNKRWVTINGQTVVLVTLSHARKSSSQAGHQPGDLSASMPGLVRVVAVKEGERVKKGQTLAVIEAMKMENKLAAPFDGLVKKVLIQPGQTVDRDQSLMQISPLETQANEVG